MLMRLSQTLNTRHVQVANRLYSAANDMSMPEQQKYLAYFLQGMRYTSPRLQLRRRKFARPLTGMQIGTRASAQLAKCLVYSMQDTASSVLHL